MMETPTEKTKRIGNAIMRLYIVETIYAMYLDHSLFLMIYRMLIGKGFSSLLQTANREDPMVGRNIDRRHRVVAALCLAIIPFWFHIPYEGTSTDRETTATFLAHTKFLTFTADTDAATGLQLLILDLLFVVIYFFLFSLAVVIAGHNESDMLALGKPNLGLWQSHNDGAEPQDANSFTEAVRLAIQSGSTPLVANRRDE